MHLCNINNFTEKNPNILMIEATYKQNGALNMENVSSIIESLKAVPLGSMEKSVCSID